MAVSASDIHLSIERIVFDGLPLASREHFLTAFREECAARLIASRFAPSASATGSAAGRRVTIDLPTGATSDALGRALARAVADLVRQ